MPSTATTVGFQTAVKVAVTEALKPYDKALAERTADVKRLEARVAELDQTVLELNAGLSAEQQLAKKLQADLDGANRANEFLRSQNKAHLEAASENTKARLGAEDDREKMRDRLLGTEQRLHQMELRVAGLEGFIDGRHTELRRPVDEGERPDEGSRPSLDTPTKTHVMRGVAARDGEPGRYRRAVRD